MRVPLAKSVINKKVVNCLKRTTATNNEVALGNIIQIMEKTIKKEVATPKILKTPTLYTKPHIWYINTHVTILG